MKQIFQNLKSGEIDFVDVPRPQTKSGHLLIRSGVSLISAGTERMLTAFARSNYLQKAIQQPDKVKIFLERMRTDGLIRTLEAVYNKLDQPVAMGYCSAGVILEGDDASIQEGSSFIKGDRVASNGPHAEVVSVPRNLCVRIADPLSDEEAVFTVPGAIGLQGIRLAEPTLGESFAVIGLGLIGLLTVQILRANGCKVLGIDFDAWKCSLATRFGAETVNLSKGEDPLSAAREFSEGRGMDGAIITAATKRSDPVNQAARMCRKRGRIVLIGVTGMTLNRADFYEKEISFQVSCSYGPGRYDREYEDEGHDYPLGYVRWTEQRNFEAVMALLSSGRLDVKPLITHRFPFGDAQKAYDLLTEEKEPYLGILLTYGDAGKERAASEAIESAVRLTPPKEAASPPETPVIGFIGAGNFSGQVLLPAIKKTRERLKAIVSRGGVSAAIMGRKFCFEESATDPGRILADSEINTVFITTRHDTHARFVLEALRAGKHVFVEKPLCITEQELEEIVREKQKAQTILMVGFNRRFSPLVTRMKELLGGVRAPKSMIMTVNTGPIPKEHWLRSSRVGGGGIIGEACHFVDLLRFLADAEIRRSEIMTVETADGDTASINLSFSDGSIGTIHYFGNGSKSFPKERLEVFCGGMIFQLDNFIRLHGYGWQQFKNMRLWRQDKGHDAEVLAFLNAVKNADESPIPFDEIEEVMRVTLELAGRRRAKSTQDNG